MRAMAAIASGLLASCSPSTAHPPYAAQPQGALVEVTSSPPPGRVEALPDRPNPEAVWVDGEWAWRRTRWAWQPGRWLVPPSGAKFSPWAFVRGRDGRLWYAPGTWRDAHGAPESAPPALATAVVGSAPVVTATGEIEETGPTLRPAQVAK